jgi:hypothetical protein
MLDGSHRPQLYCEWLGRVRDPEARNAFLFVVGLAACSTKFVCFPQQKGVIRDFRFVDDEKRQLFSFLPTTRWLLFYFRRPAIRTGHYSMTELQSAFGSVGTNQAGEWTVKIANIEAAQRLWKIIHP